jgi:putative ABC transport system permease protein
MNDLLYAFRTLRRAPGFTATATLTLALGIGANTAIFSMINAVLLKPLPYRDASRLVRLNEGRPGFELNVSYPNFLDWRARTRVFEDMAVYNPYGRAIVSGNGRAEAVPASTAESRLFTLLGIQPAHGRLFSPDEEKRGGPAVVLLSHGLWLRRFGGSTTVVGQPITVSGSPMTVVGVLPPEFRIGTTELWYPLEQGIGPMQLERGNHPGFQVLARLREGVDVERAQREMSAIAADLERQYPATNHQMGVFVRPLLDSMISRVRPMLLLLGGAVAFLLLIACANVANVLLARGLRRERETAVRSALGASRLRIVRLFLTESLAVAAVGGTAGVLLAAWIVRALRTLPAFAMPRASDISVDATVLSYAVGLTILTSVIFGLAPALQLSRLQLTNALRQAGASAVASGHGRVLRAGLVTVEVALSLMLLVGAGLMLRTLAQLAAVNPGYVPEGLVTVNTQYPRSPLPNGEAGRQFAQFADRLVDDLRRSPGISAAAVAWPLDLVGPSWAPFANFPDRPFPAGQEPAVQMASVSPSYFETMRIPLRTGRLFGAQDRGGAPVVAVINEEVVSRFLPEGDPVGRRMSLVGIPELQDVEIVGVVGNTLRGTMASIPFTRLIQGFLFQVTPTDPLTLAAGAVMLVVGAVAAAYVPARRATRIDPLVALRHC